MAINFETLKTRSCYSGYNYLLQLKRLLPRGPIWGFITRLDQEIIQDVVINTEDEIIQDIIPPGDTIQDVILNDTSITTSLFGRLLSVFAEELARAETRAFTLLQESTPGLSTELLDSWEGQAGLPGPCSNSLDLTILERQLAVHAKLFTENQTVTKEYLIEYASILGFTIAIDEGGIATEPFIVGVARVGRNRLGGYGVENQITITVTSGSGNLEQLQCVFSKLKPAHVIIVWVDNR